MISRTALLIVSSWVSSDNYTAAQTPLSSILYLCSVPNRLSLPHLPICEASVDNMHDTCEGSWWSSTTKGFRSGSYPYQLLNLGCLKTWNPMQTGQQTCLIFTICSLKIDVCCGSGTRNSESGSVTELPASSISSNYYLHISGGKTSGTAGQHNFGLVLTDCHFQTKFRLTIVYVFSGLLMCFSLRYSAQQTINLDSQKDVFHWELTILVNRGILVLTTRSFTQTLQATS